MEAGNRLMKMSEVLAETGLGRSTIYAMMNRGEFPRPLKIGGKVIRWPASEIEAWLAALPRAAGEAAAA